MLIPQPALLPKACIICGQEWTPTDDRQARHRQTCSAACAGAASGRKRQGTHQAKTSNPAGRACTRCHVLQPHDAFAWTRAGVRRSAWCRSCTRAYNQAYHAAYRTSLAADKRAKYAAGLARASTAARERRAMVRRYRRADQKVERARRTIHLVGAYFRVYAASDHCGRSERVRLYQDARMVLAWLLRSHCWCEPDAIAVLLRTSRHTVDWYIAAVRDAIRDRPPHAGAGRAWGAYETEQLKAHAQELLRRAEGHAPGSLEPLAQPQEHEEHSAPSALDVYWRRSRRRAAAERTQSYA